jgi:hypothetical protein
MRHKIEILGVTLVAVFALSAVAASSAFAAEGVITAGVSNATVTGSQIGKNVFCIGSTCARKVECSVATFKGTLTAAASNVSVTPSYAGCISSPGGGPASVEVSNCSYSLTATIKSNATSGTGIAKVECSFFSGEITIKAFSTLGSKICEYTVGAQTASGSFSWTSQASDVLMSLSPTVKVTVSFGSAAACGATAVGTTSGTLTGEATATADTSGGVATSLKIS